MLFLARASAPAAIQSSGTIASAGHLSPRFADLFREPTDISTSLTFVFSCEGEGEGEGHRFAIASALAIAFRLP